MILSSAVVCLIWGEQAVARVSPVEGHHSQPMAWWYVRSTDSRILAILLRRLKVHVFKFSDLPEFVLCTAGDDWSPLLFSGWQPVTAAPIPESMS